MNTFAKSIQIWTIPVKTYKLYVLESEAVKINILPVSRLLLQVEVLKL